MGLKHKIINKVIEAEGGYINDPNDSGGPTRYGVTEFVARREGFRGDMRDLPRALAYDIYSRKYWHAVNAVKLCEISEVVTTEVADTAVNMGAYRAAEFLQRCLNIFNRRGTLYPDLKVDGDIGRLTLKALGLYVSLRDVEVLVKALNCLQGAFCIELAERRQKDENFVYGWVKNRVVL